MGQAEASESGIPSLLTDLSDIGKDRDVFDNIVHSQREHVMSSTEYGRSRWRKYSNASNSPPPIRLVWRETINNMRFGDYVTLTVTSEDERAYLFAS